MTTSLPIPISAKLREHLAKTYGPGYLDGCSPSHYACWDDVRDYFVIWELKRAFVRTILRLKAKESAYWTSAGWDRVGVIFLPRFNEDEIVMEDWVKTGYLKKFQRVLKIKTELSVLTYNFSGTFLSSTMPPDGEFEMGWLDIMHG